MVSALVRRSLAWLCCAVVCAPLAVACQRGESPVKAQEGEPLSRTEFTERIENFFEYQPLVPGKPSSFLIHLTDLSDGAPVEKAEVTLVVRGERETGGVETRAKVGRVTGIYVADVTVPAPGRYTIEFRVKNGALDERMVLEDFTAGGRS